MIDPLPNNKKGRFEMKNGINGQTVGNMPSPSVPLPKGEGREELIAGASRPGRIAMTEKILVHLKREYYYYQERFYLSIRK